MIYIGIDPGKGGGIAWVTPIRSMAVTNMPDTHADLLDLLRDINSGDEPCKAVLERVASRPGQSSVATFTFGEHFGSLRMALTAAGIPYDMVTPQTWQKSMSCLSGGDKNVTKRRAQELFPAIKVTHANADALLIAEFAMRRG